MSIRRRDNLKRLLAPRHVAFIGGDEAARAVQQCAAAGFQGAMWGVHPLRKELGGQPCFRGVADLPEAPDAAFLAIPPPTAVETVHALREVGAGGVVCYTAGFGELGAEGINLERALIAAAGDLALVGPNCFGLLNYVRGATLWPYGHGGKRVDRGIALVSQSGMLAGNLTMNQRSVSFAYVISAGNQAVLGVEDYMDVLVEDPCVIGIGLYLETLRDVPRFAEAAIRALEMDVPVVALKVGSSEIGARSTITHTGSLAGVDQLYRALFDRLGVVRVESPAMLLETLKMLTIAGAPQGHRLAALTCSGGDCVMLADCAEPVGVEFPQPSSRVAKQLARELPTIATVSNPLDYTTPLWGDETKLETVFQTFFNDAYDAALLVQDYPIPELTEDTQLYRADARAFIAATRAAGIPGAICSSLPENAERDTRALISGGVAPLQGINEALIAIASAAAYGERRAQAMSADDAAKLRLAPVPDVAGELELLDEWQSKRRLVLAGVPVPDGRLVDANAAPGAAEELGFPVVVKMVSARLPHKTDAGAVRVGLSSAQAVAAAVTDINRAVDERVPGAARDDFLVERMVLEPVAELLIGVQRDVQFGLAMTLASGGVLVDVIRDPQTLLLPTDRESVSRALAALKVSILLDGYRGRPPADKEATIDAVLDVARFAEINRSEIGELDINPLMVLRDGVFAVDVLLRVVRREG